MVERLKESRSLNLVSGEQAEIEFYKTIGFRDAQKLRNKFFQGVNVNTSKAQSGEIDLPMNKTYELASDLIDAHWADKKYKPEDVQDENLTAVAMELMSSFLQRSGIRAETGDNQSG